MNDRVSAALALISSVVASACCIGPLLFAAGAGGFALASLTKFRPFFIALSFLLLGLAFYATYRKKPGACAPGEQCSPLARNKRNKIALWLVTVVVLALIGLPYYSGLVYNSRASAATAGELEMQTVDLRIEGMTCAGCAAAVKLALERVPGVAGAEVDFEKKLAHVRYNKETVKLEQLAEAVAAAGYRVRPD